MPAHVLTWESIVNVASIRLTMSSPNHLFDSRHLCSHLHNCCLIDPFHCDGVETGTRRSHVNNCAYYIECVNDKAVVRSCGNETAYDPFLGVCDFYPYVLDKCVNGTNFTDETTTLSLTTEMTTLAVTGTT